MQVSVGICTCDRDALLRQVLSRLVDIDLGPLAPEDVLIIVINNRPNAATRRLCEAAAATLPVRLRYVEEPSQGISFARNRAIAEALADGADALAFIDDDDLPAPDWLRRLVERQLETGADIVMGNRQYVMPDEVQESLRDRLRQADTTDDTELWKSNGLPHRLSTCNVLIVRSTLERMGAAGPVFDPVFALMGGGDADFFCRAKRDGAAFARAERSYIAFRVWPERATARGLRRRKFKGGMSQGLLVRRYVFGTDRLTWLLALAWRLMLTTLVLPMTLFSRAANSKGTSKLFWTLGAIYGFAGGRFDYYSHP